MLHRHCHSKHFKDGTVSMGRVRYWLSSNDGSVNKPAFKGLSRDKYSCCLKWKSCVYDDHQLYSNASFSIYDRGEILTLVRAILVSVDVICNTFQWIRHIRQHVMRSVAYTYYVWLKPWQLQSLNAILEHNVGVQFVVSSRTIMCELTQSLPAVHLHYWGNWRWRVHWHLGSSQNNDKYLCGRDGIRNRLNCYRSTESNKAMAHNR